MALAPLAARRVAGRLAAIGLVAGLAACSASRASPAPVLERVTLSIVGTNDLHGGMLPADGHGGLALLGGYLKNLRAARQADGAVVLIDAGDMWQGTLESNVSEGAVVVEAYNALGYQAAAIGNHEFDYGPVGLRATPIEADDDPRGALKARARQAQFPLLAANVIETTTGRPVAWPNVAPTTTFEAAGVTVGVVGVTTSVTLTATIRSNTGGLAIAPLARTIASAAAALRDTGADVVIVAAHAGGACGKLDDPSNVASCEASSEIMRVARALDPGLVDVIVAGHTHAAIAHEVNGIAVIESYWRGRAFGRVDLEVDTGTGRVTSRRIFPPRDLCAAVEPGTERCASSSAPERSAAASYEGHPVEPDPTIDAILAPAVAAVAGLKATDLGVFVEAPVRRISASVESPLGNLFADAILAIAPGADVAINNTDGGLRADLPAGPMSYGRLFEVFPFDNRLVRLTMTAADLKRALANHIRQNSRLLGLAGARVTARCDGRTLAVDLSRANGRPVADDDVLEVATTDFLAVGPLFASVVPPDGPEIPADSPVVRDAVALWLRERGGRIRPETLVDDEHPRFPPRSRLPMRCGG